MSTMGERIRNAREAKGLLQSEVAEMIDVKSGGIVSNWEKDINKPDAEKIVRLCKALDVSASYLLDYFGEPDSCKIYDQCHAAAYEVVEMFLRLDDLDRGEIRGEMKQMLKADKYRKKDGESGARAG